MRTIRKIFNIQLIHKFDKFDPFIIVDFSNSHITRYELLLFLINSSGASPYTMNNVDPSVVGSKYPIFTTAFAKYCKSTEKTYF